MDLALRWENGTVSESNEPSLWEGLTSDDENNSSSGEEILLGLRFDSSGEELRFVILISLYALGAFVPSHALADPAHYSGTPSASVLRVATESLVLSVVLRVACLLQIAIVLTASRASVQRNGRAATPLDRVIRPLQILDATPRNFQRSEDIEIPDPPGAGDDPGSLYTSCIVSMAKLVFLIGIVVLCVHFLPIAAWINSVLEYIRASGLAGCFILAACYIPAALTASPHPILTMFSTQTRFDILLKHHMSYALQGVAISVLALSAGALYGPIDGTLIAVIGYNCGGLAGFLAGRYLVRDCVMDWITARRTALIALQVDNTLLRAGLYFMHCLSTNDL